MAGWRTWDSIQVAAPNLVHPRSMRRHGETDPWTNERTCGIGLRSVRDVPSLRLSTLLRQADVIVDPGRGLVSTGGELARSMLV